MSWAFLNSIEVSKSPQTQWGARGATAYGNRYTYDNAGYTETGTFVGNLLSQAEVDTILTAARLPWSESGSSVTLDVHGTDWSGKVASCSFQRILATDYYSGTVTLDTPTSA
jgi:hypothetical protein